jgi:uncharacterized protein YecE (DUF72 family)
MTLMSDIRIGTSGWSYPSGKGAWNGVFYPRRRPRGFDELAYYAERFDTVEVNSTFYRMPEAPLSNAWVARTPPGFLFSVKLYQKFTHPDLYLEKSEGSAWDVSPADVDQFRAGIDPIAKAGRLAAILLQFPASFHARPETRDYLDWLLRGFSGYPLAVELRHRTWSDDAAGTLARLEARDATWTLIDEPKFRDSIDQRARGAGRSTVRPSREPSAERQAPSSFLYIRLHGRNAKNWWEPDASEDRYNYLYSADELEPFANVARGASSAGRRVLMYMNNHFSAKAVANAALLKHSLGQQLPGDYPAEMVDRYPELDGVVATSGLRL